MSECSTEGCSKPATYTVTFTDPSEQVEYCDICKRWVTTNFDYEDVNAL